MERRRQVPPLTPRLRRVSLIEDYALIGDLQTAALVSREGSIDWCCFPRFDSGACFASILGSPDNGRWLLAPATDVRSTSRRYRHDTLVLETVYETDQGTVRAIDSCRHGDMHPTSCGSSRGSRGPFRCGSSW